MVIIALSSAAATTTKLPLPRATSQWALVPPWRIEFTKPIHSTVSYINSDWFKAIVQSFTFASFLTGLLYCLDVDPAVGPVFVWHLCAINKSETLGSSSSSSPLGMGSSSIAGSWFRAEAVRIKRQHKNHETVFGVRRGMMWFSRRGIVINMAFNLMSVLCKWNR